MRFVSHLQDSPPEPIPDPERPTLNKTASKAGRSLIGNGPPLIDLSYGPWLASFETELSAEGTLNRRLPFKPIPQGLLEVIQLTRDCILIDFCGFTGACF